MTACEMCGALVGNQDAHDRWHVRWHEFDVAVTEALEQAVKVLEAALEDINQVVGRVEDISTVQDIDGERIESLEGGG